VDRSSGWDLLGASAVVSKAVNLDESHMSDLDAYFEMLHTDRRITERAESERIEQEWWERLTPIERWIVKDRTREKMP
jgi:hypothetical protein